MGILIFTACAGPSAPSTKPELESPPTPTKLEDGLEDFNNAARLWESYWYSRYNLGNLVMMSGRGITFMPDMEMMQKVVQMVDQGPEEGDHVMPSENPALLTA